MNRQHASRLLLVGFVVVGLATAIQGEDKPAKTRTVKAKGIALEVPESWTPEKPKSNFRAAQVKIESKDKKESAELVVFHFGGTAGGVKANVDRWLKQFQEKGRKVNLLTGESKQGKYVYAEIAGTWKKPDGPPFARKTIDAPNSRVINIIVMKKEDDFYFLKLAGPDKLVASHAKALRKSFGADLSKEKKYEQK